MEMNTENSATSLIDLLENSFRTDWSDDEGIGSDVSLDHSDPYSSDGAVSVKETPQKYLPKTPKRNLSVKKIVKILRRSVGSNETHLSEGVPTVSEFQHQKVFGVDLTEHLEQTSAVVPHILEFCCEVIEENGVTDGVYRLSGQRSHIVTLKQQFEGGKVPDKTKKSDVHAVASLLKLYFRSLPDPLLSFDLYPQFLQTAKLSPKYQLSSLRRLVHKLPKPHLATLSHLMKHMHKLSQLHKVTGMTSRNLAIVWAPNLLRPSTQDCLRDCGVQAMVIEALIVYYEEIFETESDHETRREFTKEVSIDQAVARAESFKPKVERRMMRSISCISNVRDLERRPVFQGRGVQLRRDRSLTCDIARTKVTDIDERIVPKTYQSYLDFKHEKNDGDISYSRNRCTASQETPTLDDEKEAVDFKSIKLRSSRTRLKERLNWFSSRSRLRLNSFGSSDNLRYMKEGLMRSRDKLSCALSPVRGRIGSYQLCELDCEGQDEGNNMCVMVGKWQ